MCRMLKCDLDIPYESFMIEDFWYVIEKSFTYFFKILGR